MFFGRIINFLLISVPLAFIFNHLKFKWIHTLIIIQLFVMSSQNFFGGEWMIGGLEPKSFAYIFIFYGFYYFLQQNYKKVSINQIMKKLKT